MHRTTGVVSLFISHEIQRGRLNAPFLLVFFATCPWDHMASSSTTLTTKQKVGLEMLSEALEGDFGAAFGVLVKVLGNLVANPDDAKYRKLRTSNAKIQVSVPSLARRAPAHCISPTPPPPPPHHPPHHPCAPRRTILSAAHHNAPALNSH